MPAAPCPRVGLEWEADLSLQPAHTRVCRVPRERVANQLRRVLPQPCATVVALPVPPRINQEVVNTINKGEIHIVEPDLDQVVSDAVKEGYLKASTQAVEANVYLIVVPTPFKENHEPDISFVEAATKVIIPLMKEGDLYIIESTSPIGTTEKMQNLILLLLFRVTEWRKPR